MIIQLEIPKEYENDYQKDRLMSSSDGSLQTLILLECAEITRLRQFK